MFTREKTREIVKHGLSLARIKILYERLTLTRFTALYFVCALVTGILLSSFHAASLAHDSEAANVLGDAISHSHFATGVTRLKGNTIELCSGLPGAAGTTCTGVFTFDRKAGRKRGSDVHTRDDDDDDNDDEEAEDSDDDDDDDDIDHHGNGKGGVILPTIIIPIPTVSSPPASTSSSSLTLSTSSSSTSSSSATLVLTSTSSTSLPQETTRTFSPTVTSEPTASTTISSPRASVSAVFSGNSEELSDACVVSLRWVKSTLHDAQREDLVAFFFSIWLFILSIVTLLNESIPHLATALTGHALASVWAAYRVYFIRYMRDRYRNQIVPNACDGHDFMGGWWEDIVKDVIPLVVINGVAILALGYLSFMLFRVYAHQTFKRVGASSKVHRIYKLVLVFSVFLQLSWFMSLASSAMWIDKVSAGTLSRFASHSKLYLAVFVVTLLLQFPWIVLGWISIRREAKLKFIAYCVISAILIAFSILMFCSDVYRYIFSNWPFFATITVTSFILLAGSVVLGALCRANFGKGLAQYLSANEALEDDNFTPVFFEKQPYVDERCDSPTLGKYGHDLPYSAVQHNPQFPVPTYMSHGANKTRARGSSIYSDANMPPILLSASPPSIKPPSTDSESTTSGLSKVLKTLSISSGFSKIGNSTQGNVAATLMAPPVSFPGLQSKSKALRASTTTSTTDISSVYFNTRRDSTSTNGSNSKMSLKQNKGGLPANPRAGRSQDSDRS